MLILLTLLISTAGLLLYYLKSYVTHQLNFWEEQGFFTIRNHVSLWDVLTGSRDAIAGDTDYYSQLKDRKEKVGGVMELGPFGTPILFIRDLDIARDIFIKDFDHFFDRRGFGDFDKLLNDGLFAMKGQPWKDMRAFLSPTFTSGRIRNIFPHFERHADHLKEYLNSHKASNDSGFDIQIAEAMRKFTLQVIGSAAFGLDTNTFSRNDTLYQMAERFSHFSLWRKVRVAIVVNFPKIAQLLKIRGLDADVSDFFWGMLTVALKSRQEGKVKGNDFLQMLVDAQRGNLKEDKEDLTREEKEAELKPKYGGNKDNIKWTNELGVTQAFTFMSAGFDTVANNLAVATYILATHQDIQDKVYDEVIRVIGDGEDGGKISYEDVSKLEYVDMFISEVLRLYPAVSRLDRKCMEDYTLPGNNGSEKPKVIKKGTNVAIPAEAIQRDPQYYPDPLKFDPERFTQENKSKRNPYAYMPFGIGPRNCIGMRFALVETKVALAHLIRNFAIGPTDTTPVPERIARNFFGYRVPSDIQLRFTPRS